MSTKYSVTNAQLRADAEVTRKMSFAGRSIGSATNAERLYIPGGSIVTVDFGKRLGALQFQMGDAPAWSDTIVAAIKRTASFKEKMAARKTKAEPVFTYTGRAIPKTPQPKLTGKYPKFPQPGLSRT